MKKILNFFIVLVLTLNILTVFAQDATKKDEVIFSSEGGFYSKEFDLELKAQGGAKIYYTLNGSTPTEKSLLYSKPIEVKPPSLEEAPLSNAISDNPWFRPANVFTARVIKAVAIYPNGQKSKVYTNTYFIHEDMESVFKVPVMSVTMEPEDLVGSEKGMYTNYNDKSLRPQAFVEYYEKDGKLGFKHSAEIRVAGHAARASRKKSLRFNFRKGEYEDDGKSLNYDLFPDAIENYVNQDKKVTKHAKVTARISDWEKTTLRESLTEKMAKFLRPNTFSTESVAVFINGEFWGLYELREQLDDHYIAQHYDEIKKEDVVILSFDWDTKNREYKSTNPLHRVSYDEGPEEDEEKYLNDFLEIYTLITGGKIEDPNVYEKIKSRIDIDNFIDYFAVYLFTDNIDWPGNNIKMWRTVDETTENPSAYAKDGKWRFVVHDFDIAYDNVDSNTLNYYTTPPHPTDARVPKWAADLISSLLQNDEFNQKFAARYSTYVGTVFSAERTTQLLEELKTRAETGLEHDFLRWGLNIRFRRIEKPGEEPQFDIDTDVLKNWINGPMRSLKRFLEERPEKTLTHIEDYYKKKLNKDGGFTTISFQTNPQNGYFEISGARINPEAYGDKMAYSFKSNYLNNMPIEVKYTFYDKKPLYFEVFDGNEVVRVDDTSFTYVPKGGDVSIKAIYSNNDITPLRDEFSVEDGKVNLKTTIINNTNENKDAIIYAVFYNKDGKLLGVSSKIIKNLDEEKSLKFSLDLKDSDTKEISYKIVADVLK